MSQHILSGAVSNPGKSGGGTYAGPTHQNNVTGSRVLNTVYQNTTGLPMWVYVTGNGGSGAAISLEGLTDSSNPPTTDVGYVYGAVNNSNAQISFLVLPGNYYKVLTGLSSTLTVWIEYY